MDANKKRGRQPGTLVNFKCKLCAKVELTKGGGQYFRCTSCKESGTVFTSSRRESITGRYFAQKTVADLIKCGELPHPTNFQCTDCGGHATEYEHRDYNKPEQVEPICRGCNIRRGPAIPLHGAFQKIISNGGVPYVLRCRVKKLLDAVGVSTKVLDGMPKRLDPTHWGQIMRVWPDTSTQQAT